MGPEAHLPSARIHLGRRSRKLFFLAFSLRPSRLRGESAVSHSPPKRKERKESANKNSFQAAKDLRVSSREDTEMHRRDFPGRVSHGGTRRQTRRAPLRGTLTGTEPQRHPRLRGEAFVRRGSDQFDIWSAEYPLLVNPRSAMKSGIRARRRIAGLIESSE